MRYLSGRIQWRTAFLAAAWGGGSGAAAGTVLGALAAYLGIGYALWRYLGITWPDPCWYGPNPACAGGA